MLNGLDLFSGIGGISLALEPWVATIAYCESDRYAQSVLLSRMASGHLRSAPIWNDVRSLSTSFLPQIDIITGGFPCQDISFAGRGAGLGGQRSGLFAHIARLVSEANPRLVFLENVPAIRTRGLNSVIQSFTELGYDCRWTVVSAAEIGAPHLRKRWFLLAKAQHPEAVLRKTLKRAKSNRNNEGPKALANAESCGWKQGNQDAAGSFFGEGEVWAEERNRPTYSPRWWIVEPDLDRMVDGVPCRVDRLRGLGNSVVPAQAREAFKRLSGWSKP